LAPVLPDTVLLPSIPKLDNHPVSKFLTLATKATTKKLQQQFSSQMMANFWVLVLKP
jgi:hypothetical protein